MLIAIEKGIRTMRMKIGKKNGGKAMMTIGNTTPTNNNYQGMFRKNRRWCFGQLECPEPPKTAWNCLPWPPPGRGSRTAATSLSGPWVPCAARQTPGLVTRTPAGYRLEEEKGGENGAKK